MNDKTLTIKEGTSFGKVFLAGRDEVWFDTIVMEANSSADIVFLIGPGMDYNLTLKVSMQGRGARINMSGAYLCKAANKVNIAVELDHDVADCYSKQLFKGIADDSSRVSFHGLIKVAKDSQRTEAYQENHSLLLSEGARVTTQPQLEIYADDVKCTHGATIGRLNEDEQFYMRSRGISIEDAKLLQVISFIHPVLDIVTDEETKAELVTELETAVRGYFE